MDARNSFNFIQHFKLSHQIERTLLHYLAVLYRLTLATPAPALPVYTDIRGMVPCALTSLLGFSLILGVIFQNAT